MTTLRTVEPGFIDVYGYVWDQVQCDQYNKISQEVWEKENLGMPVNELRNDRFRIYTMPYYSANSNR